MLLRNLLKLEPPPTTLPPLVIVASTLGLSGCPFPSFGLLGRKFDIFILFGIPFLSELLTLVDDDDMGLWELELQLVVVIERE